MAVSFSRSKDQLESLTACLRTSILATTWCNAHALIFNTVLNSPLERVFASISLLPWRIALVIIPMSRRPSFSTFVPSLPTRWRSKLISSMSSASILSLLWKLNLRPTLLGQIMSFKFANHKKIVLFVLSTWTVLSWEAPAVQSPSTNPASNYGGHLRLFLAERNVFGVVASTPSINHLHLPPTLNYHFLSIRRLPHPLVLGEVWISCKKQKAKK